MRKILVFIILATFITNVFVPPSCAQILMSHPGEMVALSQTFRPSLLTGVKIYAHDPFRIDFIMDRGDEGKSVDANRLVKYFLASLAVPEKDLWVNLSPYEKDRIVPAAFGQTEMGRDLLAQDYFLKQLTASLMYPEGDLGKKFWSEVYRQAQAKFGTTDIPVDTFNKVWITPAKVEVFENKGVAYVVDAKLKVMLEADYVSMGNTVGVGEDLVSSPKRADIKSAPTQNMTQALIRQIILPALEKEVNEGKSFTQLRQVYNSLILATWFKRKVIQSDLWRNYADQNKVVGINIADPQESGKIWVKYVEAFKKGAYNFIKEEKDAASGDVVPRKYFSGGFDMAQVGSLMSIVKKIEPKKMAAQGHADNMLVNIKIMPYSVKPQKRTASAGDMAQQQAYAILRRAENAYRNIYQEPELFDLLPGSKFNQGKQTFSLVENVREAIYKGLVNLAKISEQRTADADLLKCFFGISGSLNYLRERDGTVYWDGVNDLDIIISLPYPLSDSSKNVITQEISKVLEGQGINISYHAVFLDTFGSGYRNNIDWLYANFSDTTYFRLDNKAPLKKAFDVLNYGRLVLQQYAEIYAGMDKYVSWHRLSDTASLMKVLKRILVLARLRGDMEMEAELFDLIKKVIKGQVDISTDEFIKKVEQYKSNVRPHFKRDDGSLHAHSYVHGKNIWDRAQTSLIVNEDISLDSEKAQTLTGALADPELRSIPESQRLKMIAKAGLAALTAEEVAQLNEIIPQFDWRTASLVPWTECVRDDQMQPVPESENQVVYWDNLTAARREFLGMIVKFALKQIPDVEAFRKILEGIHKKVLIHRDGRVYRSADNFDMKEDVAKGWAGVLIKEDINSARVQELFQYFQRLVDFGLTRPKLVAWIGQVGLIYHKLIWQNLFYYGNNSMAMDINNGFLRFFLPLGISHNELDQKARRSSVIDPRFIPDYVARVKRTNWRVPFYLEQTMDQAMDKGGIDLNSTDNLLQVKNSGDAIKFDDAPGQIEQYKNAAGFIPVVMDVQPLESLPVFLGISGGAP
ncbi:MAG: hypothetical protein HQL17_05030 [Candidatus Omnitrophica bacterium]|nr:hypothetical protein [Candidatus Omnitrophota bacterium]